MEGELNCDFSKNFSSYLSERKQFVKINKTNSQIKNTKLGVPQGSLLGPILFIIYVNDIFDLNLNGVLTMYADDMVLLYAEDCLEQLKSKIQTDINLINGWCTRNNFLINIKKSHYIFFELRNKLIEDFQIKLSDEILKRVNYTKYLGLIIDSKLDWSEHIKNIYNKIRYPSFILRKCRNSLPYKIKMIIFHSYIMSHFRYLLPVWGSLPAIKTNEIHITLNKILRNIRGLHYRSSSSILYNIKVLPFKLLFKYELLILVYKIKNNFIKNNFLLTEIGSLHIYPTRNARNFRLSFCRTNLGQSNILYEGVNLFNALPDNIKNELRISTFKNELKNYLYINH